MENSRGLLGRFVVKLPGQTATGLTADEVRLLLETPEGREAEAFRIHRVTDDRRMELVGVSHESFARDDCLIFSRADVKEARSDFDRIVEHATPTPPPCRIEIQFSRVPGFAPPCVVAMIFIAAAGDAVGQWLREMGLQPGEHADGGSQALAAYRAANPQIMEQKTLEARTA